MSKIFGDVLGLSEWTFIFPVCNGYRQKIHFSQKFTYMNIMTQGFELFLVTVLFLW